MTNLDSIEHYDYVLPQELIATRPAATRTGSRVMILDRGSQAISTDGFGAIVNQFSSGDLLVFNDTQVVPARLFATKPTGGRVELLITDVESPANAWSQACDGPVVLAMTRSSKPVRVDTVLSLESGHELEVLEMLPGRRARLRLPGHTSVADFLAQVGTIPLPPYIVRERHVRGEEEFKDDDVRYQTVYASKPGAIAAPTAGLHFTREILDELSERGVETAFVTLEVGPGTFKPVTAERLSEHPMHREWYEIPEGLGERIAAVKQAGRRVVAVGTTTVRVLESEHRLPTPFEPGRRATDLLLQPGSTFGVVDGLLTNFHLPKSTLLALVAGFAGYELTMQAYAQAVEERLRFYSYGDAMLVSP